MTFDNGGTLTNPSAPTQFGVFTPSDTASNQQITIDLAGRTQKTGSTEILAQVQDGISVGDLQGVTVDEEVFVKARFSICDTQRLGKNTPHRKSVVKGRSGHFRINVRGR